MVTMAATQHHGPGMFVPRVFAIDIISQLDVFYQETYFQLDLSPFECTLCISNKSDGSPKKLSTCFSPLSDLFGLDSDQLPSNSYQFGSNVIN